MEPNNSSINNNPPTTNPNFQQPANPVPELTQSAPVAPVNENPQQPPAVPPSYGMNGQLGQNTPKMPQHIKVLTRICLISGIVTVVGTIFTIIGLVSGIFFSNQGAAMVSSLLLGAVYALIRQYGTILCVATLIAILVAKNRYHISVKRPVLVTICSMLMLYTPTIIISCFA